MFAPRYNDSSLEERFLIRDILVHLSQPASVFKRILFALRTYETTRNLSQLCTFAWKWNSIESVVLFAST
jgi:hypothetical protein